MGAHQIFEMTNLQTMLTLTYSIHYGIMLDSCGGLNLFPFAWLYAKKQLHAGKRIISAFSIIIFSPIISFALIYNWLGYIGNKCLSDISYNNPLYNVIIVCSIFFVSQIVFAWYRLFHIVIIECDLYDESLKLARKRKNDPNYRWRLRTIGQESMIERFIKFGPNNSGQYLATYTQLLIAYLGLITVKLFDTKITFYSFLVYYIIPFFFFIVTLKVNNKKCEKQRKVHYFLNGVLLLILFIMLFLLL